jgi:hypothetical protein
MTPGRRFGSGFWLLLAFLAAVFIGLDAYFMFYA